MGNYNAEREKARQMEEDRRFLDELARAATCCTAADTACEDRKE
jgi:hypothetical protein